MGMQKRQFAKKKKRERENKKKFVAKKEINMRKSKEIRMWEKEERESRPRQEPIKSMSDKMKQYMHNLQILEALNEEHEKGNI